MSDGVQLLHHVGFLGGKGGFVNFYESGDELFDVMCRVETELGVHSFFIMDENFLLYRPRARRLLELMKRGNKSWGLAVFSSANAIRKYAIEELVELGISWVWLGLESPRCNYGKLQGTDTKRLARELRENGIRVQGSTIIGLEHHTPDNIIGEIDYAVDHQTDFHQFMLYTPIPGTQLYRDMAAEGRIIEGLDPGDAHGQYKFNFVHPAISRDQSKTFLDWAFRRDFEANGPSLFRMAQTAFWGWTRYRNYPDRRVRDRFAREMNKVSTAYSGALWAMERDFRKVNREVSRQIGLLRQQIEKQSSIAANVVANLLRTVMLWTSRWEEKRLSWGRTYEPPMIVERRNWEWA